jgi:23S rRNA (pseudouridine1915-N3)-methyltransferase
MILAMQLTLAHVGAKGGTRIGAGDGIEPLVQEYVKRSSAYADCRVEAFRTEEALLAWVGRLKGRAAPMIVLLDERGKQMSSQVLAQWLGTRRDEGAQQIVFAVGPADGWSEAARAQAGLLLSLGAMTLAHALARLVMAEQIYRALTILAGHPYHRQ